MPTVRRYHYETHVRLRAYLKTFLEAYNFAKCLRILRCRTVFGLMSEKWALKPQRITRNPDHLVPGPNA